MRTSGSKFVRASAAALFAVLAPAAVVAQSAGDFYKDRNIDLYIGYTTGGAYDFYARVIGRHIGAHIPVLHCDARDRSSCKQVLERLLEYLMADAMNP